MAKINRLYDFQNGTRADAEQVDAEFDNLIDAHNAQDDALANKVDIDGDFQGTWNGVAFEQADPAIAGRVTNVENMVKEEPKVTVTLKRGENIIEAPENVSLAPLEILGDEVKNLALLFDHWALHANSVKDSSDRVTLNAGGPNEVSSLKVEVKRNTDYVYSMKHTGMIAVLDATLSENAVAAYTTEQVIKFNSGNNSIIHLAFKSNNDEAGTFTFEAPSLVEGTVERESVQTYQPIRGPYIEVDNGSRLYFDEYIYKGDKLYEDEQGNWRKKQNKIESLLTAENVKNPSINTSYTGGKAIKIPLSEIAKGIDIYETECIEFNHTYLVKTDSAANITNDRYYVDNDNLLLFMSSNVTGWGDDVTPSKPEIVAFILGYKMAHNDGTAPYKEADKGTKGDKKWLRITGAGESATLPQETYHEWSHFKLIYGTLTEQDVPAKYEGSLRLSKGTNKVTLGEGISLREIVTPALSGTDYVIDDTITAYQIDKAIEVTKAGKKDEWVLGADAKLNQALFDPIALYQFTYKVKNRFAHSCYAGDTQAEYAPNFHMESNEQVRELQELKNRVTQHELAVVDKLGKPNGIVMYDEKGTGIKGIGFTDGGLYTDTSTQIEKSTTYIKRFPVPPNAKRGSLIVSRGKALGIVHFDTDKTNTLGVGCISDSQNGTGYRIGTPGVGDGLFGDTYDMRSPIGYYIALRQAYISKETNELVLEFYNTSASASRPLAVNSMFWEVS